MSPESAKIAISEENNYTRHVFTSAIAWFTFFMTVNYASMGWLASAADKLKGNYAAVFLICVLFFFQNCFGIYACIHTHHYFVQSADRLKSFHSAFGEGSDKTFCASYFPEKFYRKMLVFMVFAMATVLIAWAVFPLVYPR